MLVTPVGSDAEDRADDDLQRDGLRHALHRELDAWLPPIHGFSRDRANLVEIDSHAIAVELGEHQLTALPMRRLVQGQYGSRPCHRAEDTEVCLASMHRIGWRGEHRPHQGRRRQHHPWSGPGQLQGEDVAKLRGALVEQFRRSACVAICLNQSRAGRSGWQSGGSRSAGSNGVCDRRSPRNRHRYRRTSGRQSMGAAAAKS